MRLLKSKMFKIICKFNTDQTTSGSLIVEPKVSELLSFEKNKITIYTMRSYILAETNWKNIKDANIELAILPWSATEAHNYHLPYGTDIYEANHITAESARIAYEAGAKCMVLPTIPFGVNSGQHDILLDINLNPSTQMIILRDIITVLNRQGIYKLLVFNSHGGNSFKPMIRELGLEFPKMFICESNWFKAMDRNQYAELDGDHADEIETSLMMYIEPNLVLPLSEAGDGATKRHKIKAFREPWLWAERRWSQITEDTGCGDPSRSTAAKGEKFFTDLCEKFAKLLVELSDLDIEDMYV